MRIFLTFSIILLTSLISSANPITLYDYGWAQAKTGEDRFWVLYNAHADAVKKNCSVNYSGLHDIEIEIPANAKSIPLTEKTNFRNVSLTVKNSKKRDFVLFKLENKQKEIEVSKVCFRTFDFSAYPELRNGTILLVVNDETPWVGQRIGYNYGATRYDILLLKNGIAVNRPVSPYSNDISIPKCSFVVASTGKKYFKNITFNRERSSTQKTFLLAVKNQNNVEVSGIRLNTPQNDLLYGDHIISFDNCTNVTLKKVTVNNTYSKVDQFGYAFTLYNVWNTNVSDIKAEAPWGVFGNNNVNKAVIKNCVMNRFDLHCYGRDYSFENCVITSGIPIGSFLGTMSFKNCHFKSGTPCLYRYDYNAYMPFSLEFEKCVVEMDKNYHCFMYFSQLSKDENSRAELRKKNLPNVKIKNCEVRLADGLTSFDIVYMGKNYYQSPLAGMEMVQIDGLKVKGNCEAVRVITNSTKTVSSVDLILDKLYFEGTQSPKVQVNLKDKQGKSANLKAKAALKKRITIENR